MTRVALYARYSTDNQREASIEDRFRICREEAKREKWKIVGAYRNAGISGRVHYWVPGPGSAQLHRCSCRQSFSRHWALPQHASPQKFDACTTIHFSLENFERLCHVADERARWACSS
jgi:hypothetical protein